MRALIKNSLVILFFILAIAGCKDNEEPELIQGVVYEDWQLLPDFTLGTSENILAIEYRGERVHLQTSNSYFGLDTNLSLVEKHSIFSPTTSFDLWAPKYGNEYAIFPNELRGFTIIDLQQPTNDGVTLKTSANYFGQSVFVMHHSEITTHNEFSTVTMTRNGDFVYTILQNFRILHTPNTPNKINVEEVDRIVLDSIKSEGWPLANFAVYKNDEYALYNLNRKYFVFSQGELISKRQYFFRNMINYDGLLYAGGDTMENLISGGANWIGGLYASNNQGKSWELIIEDKSKSLYNVQFEVLDDFLIIYGESGDFSLSTFNPQKIEVKRINTNGLPGRVLCIEKVGNKVLVGTSNGVYYKSWESFLNK